ncbi:MAG: FAD:protein FMN transferase [Chlorobiaceae bacterium]|nr:FAD:protein FMN transferase [Chlorobiaceae bacterium]
MFRIGFRAMGCGCEIVIASTAKKEAKAISAVGIKEVGRIERKYSRYLAGSVVSKINEAAADDWVECDEETSALLDYADVLYQGSDGLFDITSGVLRRAWDFDKAKVPAPESLFPLLKLIGWKQVERKGNSIRLQLKGMQLDFGGIGKEYAADAAATILLENGVTSGYVNLAGDIRVIGPKPGGEPWIIGIQDPRNSEKMIASIPIYSGGLATSGDYERFFETGGRRYCHILNPVSGFPVSFWRSITVLAPLATTAGSCTTIAMLKESDGLSYLRQSGMMYFAIDQSGKMYHNE